MVITVLLGIKSKDTQCGFKLFTKQAAITLFRTLHIERFAFDVELFFLCNKFNVSTG
jgi:dolichyl-phosphate beta-glucosyltransferase